MSYKIYKIDFDLYRQRLGASGGDGSVETRLFGLKGGSGFIMINEFFDRLRIASHLEGRFTNRNPNPSDELKAELDKLFEFFRLPHSSEWRNKTEARRRAKVPPEERERLKEERRIYALVRKERLRGERRAQCERKASQVSKIVLELDIPSIFSEELTRHGFAIAGGKGVMSCEDIVKNPSIFKVTKLSGSKSHTATLKRLIRLPDDAVLLSVRAELVNDQVMVALVERFLALNPDANMYDRRKFAARIRALDIPFSFERYRALVGA